jgi:hypothetical protein
MATPQGPPSSNIGLADVYRVLMDLQNTLTRVVTHMERIDTRNEYADKLHNDFEARLRVIEATAPAAHTTEIEKLSSRVDQLERFRYTLAGGIALLTLLLSVFGYWLGSFITGHH